MRGNRLGDVWRGKSRPNCRTTQAAILDSSSVRNACAEFVLEPVHLATGQHGEHRVLSLEGKPVRTWGR